MGVTSLNREWREWGRITRMEGLGIAETLKRVRGMKGQITDLGNPVRDFKSRTIEHAPSMIDRLTSPVS